MVLDWLDAPSERTGISFLEGSGRATYWEFVSYAWLAERVTALSRLVARRVPPESPVILASPTRVSLVVAWHACVLAGCPPLIAAPVGFEQSKRFEHRLLQLLEGSGATLVLASADAPGLLTKRDFASVKVLDIDEAVARASAGPGVRRPSRVAYLQATSGTTGPPRLLGVTPTALEENLLAARARNAITADDSGCVWLPLYHDLGLVASFLSLTTAQIPARLMRPEQFVAQPMLWLRCFGESGFTLGSSPAFGLEHVIRRMPEVLPPEWDFADWRVLCLGGDRLDARTLLRFSRRLRDRGFDPRTLSPGYGLAEATVCVSCSPASEPVRMVDTRDVTAGRSTGAVPAPIALTMDSLSEIDERVDWLVSNGPPLDGIEVLTAPVTEDDDDRLLGEILVRTPSAAHRWRAGDLLERADEGTGLLRTGDSGFVADGEVFVLGRLGDAVKVRGRLIHALDVESHLRSILGLFRGCVVLGTRMDGTIEALLVLHRSPKVEWVEDAVNALRASLPAPVEYGLVVMAASAVPQTSSGKPRRLEIWRRRLDDELEVERLPRPPAQPEPPT